MATKVENAVAPRPAKTAAEALQTLRSNRDAGLAKADPNARLFKQGPNECPERHRYPPAVVFAMACISAPIGRHKS